MILFRVGSGQVGSGRTTGTLIIELPSAQVQLNLPTGAELGNKSNYNKRQKQCLAKLILRMIVMKGMLQVITLTRKAFGSDQIFPTFISILHISKLQEDPNAIIDFQVLSIPIF